MLRKPIFENDKEAAPEAPRAASPLVAPFGGGAALAFAGRF